MCQKNFYPCIHAISFGFVLFCFACATEVPSTGDLAPAAVAAVAAAVCCVCVRVCRTETFPGDIFPFMQGKIWIYGLLLLLQENISKNGGEEDHV